MGVSVLKAMIINYRDCLNRDSVDCFLAYIIGDKCFNCRFCRSHKSEMYKRYINKWK